MMSFERERLIHVARSLLFKLGIRRAQPRATMAEWEARIRRHVDVTVQRALPHIPERGGVIVDVGANVGAFTEGVLRQRPDLRAYLFEPVREMYERCAERFADRPEIVVEHVALGDYTGGGRIWKPARNKGGGTMFEVVADRFAYLDLDVEDVRCTTFDRYAAENGVGHVDFVKSDAEAFDIKVLKGMLGLLGRTYPRPVILAELVAEWIYPDLAEMADVFDRLHDIGYPRVDSRKLRWVKDYVLEPAAIRSVTPL